MRTKVQIKLALLGLAGCLLILLGWDLADNFGDVARQDVNAQGAGMTPKKTMLDKETEEKLFSLAQGDPDIAEIYADRASYPPELLNSLTLNRELLDFVKGWPGSDGSVTGGFTAEETPQTCPLLLQWDSRWGYSPYGESCLGLSGCGPTCLSMVIYSLTGDENATPDKLADYSMKHGHYVKGSGTAWSLMTDAPADYGISSEELGLDEAVMKRCLNRGGMIICAMRPGDFTTTGHFIVIRGYGPDGFWVNDPNSRERSGKAWPFSTLKGQIKNLWAFYESGYGFTP